MLTRTPIAAIAASLIAVSCGGGQDVSTVQNEANAAVKPIVLPWVFTKMPVTQSQIAITTPVLAQDLFTFSVDTTTRADAAISRMVFYVQGTAPVGTFANFQIVYFPDGLKKAGTVVATNDGSTWTPIAALDFALATPIPVKKNFNAVFVLRADVSSPPPYFFSPRLQMVAVTTAGTERFLDGYDSCDLPMQGDQFTVN